MTNKTRPLIEFLLSFHKADENRNKMENSISLNSCQQTHRENNYHSLWASTQISLFLCVCAVKSNSRQAECRRRRPPPLPSNVQLYHIEKEENILALQQRQQKCVCYSINYFSPLLCALLLVSSSSYFFPLLCSSIFNFFKISITFLSLSLSPIPV